VGARFSSADRFSENEPEALRFAGSLATAGLLSLLACREAPDLWRGVACMAVAVVLLELGMRSLPAELRHISYAVAAFGAALVAVLNLPGLPASGAWGPRSVPAVAAAGAFAIGIRAHREEHGRVLAIACWVGSFFVAAAARALLPVDAVAPVWAAAALVLLIFKQRHQAASFAGIAFLRVCSAPLVPSAAVIAALYAAQFATPSGTRLRSYFSLLASTLVSVLLYHRVSGSVLTVAWGAQGVFLLACGFPLRDRLLRLSGLALLWFCIFKLFFHDLGYLETLPRILSFLALGVILVAVSWIYTRYRARVRRYL
jgi:uncharacterized membrane protein